MQGEPQSTGFPHRLGEKASDDIGLIYYQSPRSGISICKLIYCRQSHYQETTTASLSPVCLVKQQYRYIAYNQRSSGYLAPVPTTTAAPPYPIQSHGASATWGEILPCSQALSSGARFLQFLGLIWDKRRQTAFRSTKVGVQIPGFVAHLELGRSFTVG